VTGEEALEAECRWTCMNGFDAKYAVHPGQVPIIEKVFGSKWDVDQAVRILDEFNRHDSLNSIRSGITGDYIGLPVLKQALSKLKIQYKNVE
jgi:citrate lyase beta subunit